VPGFDRAHVLAAPAVSEAAAAPARPGALRALSIGMTWVPEQPANGLDRGYYEHVRHLPPAGVSVRGLVAGTPDVERQSGGAVRAFASDKASLVTRVMRLRRAVRQELVQFDPDVVIAHFALHGAPAVDLFRRPLVVHFHGPWAAESAVEGGSGMSVAMKRVLEKRLYRHATRFVVLSKAFRKLLIEGYGVDEARVRIVPGGVDVQAFDLGVPRDEARNRLGWPADRRIILSVRRLMRRMGLEGLIEAMEAVRQSAPGSLLLIAGRGPHAAALQAEIDARGLGDHARLLGFVPDEHLPLAYAAADISVMPTVALEGFGLPTVESLASGTPVLVTPQGGLPEVVTDLDPQLVCEDVSAGALAERIGDVFSGRVVLPTAEACRSYARAGFSWESVARRLAVVYREAHDERG